MGTNRNGDGMVADAGRRMVGVQKLILEYKLKMYYYYLLFLFFAINSISSMVIKSLIDRTHWFENLGISRT